MDFRRHSKTIGLIGGQAVFDYLMFQFLGEIHQFVVNLGIQSLEFNVDFIKFGLGIIGIAGASILGYALFLQLRRKLSQRTITVTKEMSEPNPPLPVSKVLGNPDSVDNGVQVFNRRSHLPFDEFLAEADQRVDMIAVTFHCVTTSHIGLIEDTIYRGIRVTFLILDPNSRYAENRKTDFHEGEEVKHHIERSLHVLCELKKRLKDEYRDNLVIKTYDDTINESITIIDNKLIKIEKHQKGSDSDSRPNELAFNNDNQSFFQRYSQSYQKIKPMDYPCSD